MLNFSQYQMSSDREVGERSHLDVNNDFLEAEFFFPTIYRETYNLNVFDKSSNNLIVFKP
jgi:hypothetical protein